MLTTTHLVGFDWLNSTNAASATATATATGTAPTVTSVGTGGGGSSSSSVTFTVPVGGIPANSVIIVAAGANGTSTITSGSDTKGNTYQVGKQTTGTAVSGGLVYSQNGTALVSGDVITINFAGSVNRRGIVVGYATGLTTGTLIDKNAAASGTSTSPSSGTTAATTIASELVVGFMAYTWSTSTTVTEASGYSIISSVSVNKTGTTYDLRVAYKVVAATGAQTYAPSLGASKDWVCGVETLKT